MRASGLLFSVVASHLGCLGCQGSASTHGCSSGTVQLGGSIEGTMLSGPYSGPSDYVFVNAMIDKPGTLSFGFGSGGKLYLTWTEAAAPGQSTAAYGTLTMPSGGPFGGQAFCVSAAMLSVPATGQGDAITFQLSTLVEGPCAGSSVEGSIEGCAAPPM
jgi:hypothetical protein